MRNAIDNLPPESLYKSVPLLLLLSNRERTKKRGDNFLSIPLLLTLLLLPSGVNLSAITHRERHVPILDRDCHPRHILPGGDEGGCVV